MSEKGIIFRRMVLEDIGQVHDLDQSSFPTPWPLKSFRYELEKNKAAHLWVAEECTGTGEKKIVGSIVVWLLVDEAHIATIAIDEGYRRRGIASRLIYTALTCLIEKGAVSSTLEVRENNHAAQALYQNFGFKPVGRRQAYYKDTGEDAIIMTLHHLDIENLSTQTQVRAERV